VVEAVFDEVCEGVVVDKPSEQGLSAGAVRQVVNDSFAEGVQLGEELAVLIGEELLEFLSQVAGISGAVALGADGNLEVAPSDDGGHEEVAKLGLVNDVAEDFELLAVFVNSAIERVVVGGGDDHCGANEIVPGVPGLYQFGAGALAQGGHHLVDVLGDDDEPGTGIEQGLGLADGDGSGPNDYGAATTHFQKYRILPHGKHIIPSPAAEARDNSKEKSSRRSVEGILAVCGANRHISGRVRGGYTVNFGSVCCSWLVIRRGFYE